MNQNRKTQKKILKLIIAISKTSDNDLILLSSLSDIAILMRDSKKVGGLSLRIQKQREMESLSSNQHILELLNK